MNRLAAYFLLGSLVVGIATVAWNDPYVQRIVAPRAVVGRPASTPSARPTAIPASGTDAAAADTFMRGMCDKDEKRMRAAAGPPFSEWSDEHWASAVASLTACTDVRYLGSVVGQRGNEYIYVLTFPDVGQEWFVLGVDDAKVVSVK